MLALAFYLRDPPDGDAESRRALSDLLRAMPIEHELSQEPSFRSAEGSVRNKLGNFAYLDTGRGRPHVGAGDRAVWETFRGRPEAVQFEAKQIARAIHEVSRSQEFAEPTGPDDLEAPEGALVTRLHRVRERSRGLPRRKKEQASRRGALVCEACLTDYTVLYGDRAMALMECHHRLPLSELSAGTATRLADLALVCANCHRLIHGRQPWLQWEDLLVLVRPLGH